MHFVHVPLYIGAFFLIAFTAILAIGSLIGLAGFLVDIVRPAAKTREAVIATMPDTPAASPHAVKPETGTGNETFVPAGAAYARC